MSMLDRALLTQLGQKLSIEQICSQAGLSLAEFHQRWRNTVESRVAVGRSLSASVASPVTITRDQLGIPSIFADNDGDLFFGFGVAMAEDRLFQLDYLRRKALGRLSETLGPDGLDADLTSRTVGLNRIAANESQTLTPAVRQRLERFADGVNAHIEGLGENLPIEFDLLDYTPEPWSALDCVAIEVEFRWYLTGRFPIITIPELAKRILGSGELYEEFVLGEADDEAIVTPDDIGRMSLGTPVRAEPIGHNMGDPEASTGSNNWVLGGGITDTAKPLLASDPHIAFEAVSCWYEAYLCGGDFQVAGMTYVGMPAIMFGRNEHISWGITNNICSQRDLYQEQTSTEHPEHFLYDGNWEPQRTLSETIHVRGGETLEKEIRFSRNGPIVDEILPLPARTTGPVSLKWLGMFQGGWLTSLHAVNQAENIEQFREALRPWHVPTFSMVVAEQTGRIGFQTSGRVPQRPSNQRGYRDGANPQDQWQGLIPFEEMPFVVEPSRGYVATANNRLAGEAYPHPLYGCWNSGWRAIRIRNMIEQTDSHSLADMGRMQLDHRSLRAANLAPALVELLRDSSESTIQQATEYLSAWDYEVSTTSVAATLFNLFFRKWTERVVLERFPADSAAFLSALAHGLAGRLLQENRVSWFASESERRTAIERTMVQTLSDLRERLGEDMATWQWGRLHQMPLKHVLSARGDLGQLLDFGGEPVGGDMWTVGNTGCGPDFEAITGAGYRMLCDLSSSPPQLLAVDSQGQSGCPGSVHYADQLDDWLNGRYHVLTMSGRADPAAPIRYDLTPAANP